MSKTRHGVDFFLALAGMNDRFRRKSRQDP